MTAVDRRYRAPALEKGLDILELLAAERGPVTRKELFDRLGRSRGELSRMVQALEFRGYIERDVAKDGYRLSDRLFSMDRPQPCTHSLIETALPVMRQLALSIGQSCHLVRHSRGEVVVAARMESDEQLGLSLCVGYRRPLLHDASGALLYAFQPPEVRQLWDKLLDPSAGEEELRRFRIHADAARERMVDLTPNRSIADVTDISAPILHEGAAAAALTVPFLETLRRSPTSREAAALVRGAAERISGQLAA